MADYQSIQMLAFNFASRTGAYRRLTQTPSRSLSAFPGFMREYLDKAIKAVRAHKTWTTLTLPRTTQNSYVPISGLPLNEGIRNAGLKLTMCKSNFGVKQVDFLGSTITPVGVAPQADKVKRFLSKLLFPKSKKKH